MAYLELGPECAKLRSARGAYAYRCAIVASLSVATPEQMAFEAALVVVTEMEMKMEAEALWVACAASLVSLNSLAKLLQDQGKLGEAEPLYREVLAASRDSMGPWHSDAIASMNNLAMMPATPLWNLRAARASWAAAQQVMQQQPPPPPLLAAPARAPLRPSPPPS